MSESPPEKASDPIKLSNDDYQLASGTGGDGRKQGHKCCGGCCDMRRAVIIVNIINAIVLTMGLFSVLAARKLSDEVDGQVDDDEVSAALEEFNSLPLGGFLAIQTAKIVLSVIGIFGAAKYSEIGVGLAMAGYVFNAVMSLVGINLFGFIFAACFAYPHAFFIKEVRAGIMTKENYPNEEFSCCCV